LWDCRLTARADREARPDCAATGSVALTSHRVTGSENAEATPVSDQDRVTGAFRRWLVAGGWTPVTPTDRWTDIEAVRDDERIIGEAKGRTSGLAVVERLST
jgi:hypothetical protein